MKVSYNRADDVLLLEVSDEGIEYAETTLLRRALTENFSQKETFTKRKPILKKKVLSTTFSSAIKTLTKNNLFEKKVNQKRPF